jgi:nucleotide-binding universal stress UspA family protein
MSIPKFTCRKILIPIDGSPKSFEAAKFAIRFSDLFENCSLTLFYVIEERIHQIRSYPEGESSDLHEKFKTQAQKYFNKVISDARAIGFNENLINSKIVQGDPVEEIVEISKDYGLIIIARRGKRHAIEYLMGHVTERVLNLSEIPVLVVP